MLQNGEQEAWGHSKRELPVHGKSPGRPAPSGPPAALPLICKGNSEGTAQKLPLLAAGRLRAQGPAAGGVTGSSVRELSLRNYSSVIVLPYKQPSTVLYPGGGDLTPLCLWVGVHTGQEKREQAQEAPEGWRCAQAGRDHHWPTDRRRTR